MKIRNSPWLAFSCLTLLLSLAAQAETFRLCHSNIVVEVDGEAEVSFPFDYGADPSEWMDPDAFQVSNRVVNVLLDFSEHGAGAGGIDLRAGFGRDVPG